MNSLRQNANIVAFCHHLVDAVVNTRLAIRICAAGVLIDRKSGERDCPERDRNGARCLYFAAHHVTYIYQRIKSM